MSEFDRSKTLQELEGEDWGEPAFESGVVENAHRLWRVPLREFTAGDCRFMIGQQIGLEYLIPIALEHLRIDPLVEADCYRGDLLRAVLRADSPFWLASPQLRAEATELCERALTLIPSLDDDDRQTAQDVLTEARDLFLRAEYFAQHGRA